MEEDVINAQELINPDEVSTQEQPQPTEEVKQEAKPVEQPQDTSMGRNFRAMREEKEKALAERDEMRRRLEYLERAKIESRPVNENTGVEDSDVPEEDYVEGKHINKMAKKMKHLEKKIEEYEQKSTMMTTQARLSSEFPDFDKVVSKDNIEVLKLTYPELAQAIVSNPDPYITAKSAYTLIKKLGIEQDLNNYEQENERANKNLAKPKPAINTQQGDSPLSMANAFAAGTTKEARMKIYRQAQEYASKKGFN